ncbi:hypothetical protein, partial [Microbacterium sp. A94]|uniref:hypothetical protein n=1 Tax=Microbacterium sp. A94 TaxID=3450717 RepID=UPI003F4272BE
PEHSPTKHTQPEHDLERPEATTGPGILIAPTHHHIYASDTEVTRQRLLDRERLFIPRDDPAAT